MLSAIKSGNADQVRKHLLEEGSDVNSHLDWDDDSKKRTHKTQNNSFGGSRRASLSVTSQAETNNDEKHLQQAEGHGSNSGVSTKQWYKSEINQHHQQHDDEDRPGRTPLYVAAWYGHSEIVKLLLDNKDCNVDQANKDGRTPLYVAAARGHARVVETLLQHGEADADRVTIGGWTALFVAVQKGHSEIIRLLLEHGHSNKARQEPELVLPENPSYDYRLLLHTACRRACDVNAIRLLAERLPESLKCSDQNGNLPLHLACTAARWSSGRRESLQQVIQYLAESYPDAVLHKNMDGQIPLQILLSQRVNCLYWLGIKQSRTILSLKQHQQTDRPTAKTLSDWDILVTLLWYEHFGSHCHEKKPPLLADSRGLPDKEFLQQYKWMIHPTCALLHLGLIGLLQEYCRVFSKEDALEVSERTQKTPLLALLESLLRHQHSSDYRATLEWGLDFLLDWNSSACRVRDSESKRIPLEYAIELSLPWQTIEKMISGWPASVDENGTDGTPLFQMAAVSGCDLSVIYSLLSASPGSLSDSLYRCAECPESSSPRDILGWSTGILC